MVNNWRVCVCVYEWVDAWKCTSFPKMMMMLLGGYEGPPVFEGASVHKLQKEGRGVGGIEGERETKIIGFQPDLCQSRWG